MKVERIKIDAGKGQRFGLEPYTFQVSRLRFALIARVGLGPGFQAYVYKSQAEPRYASTWPMNTPSSLFCFNGDHYMSYASGPLDQNSHYQGLMDEMICLIFLMYRKKRSKKKLKQRVIQEAMGGKTMAYLSIKWVPPITLLPHNNT